MPKSATERAREINAQDPDNGFKLVEDATHWAEYNIYTAEELDRYLAICTYNDIYKDIHGIRPRWVSFESLSTDEINALTQVLIDGC